MGEISGTGLAALAAGSVLVYGGLTGKSPLAAFYTIVRGGDPRGVTASQLITQAGQAADTAQGSTGGGDGSAHSASAAANQATAKMLLSSYGWGLDQWDPLVSLWNKESGWSNTADTRKTGAGGDHPGSAVFAYGIAQARPATKYPKAGQPPDLGGSADPATQIRWGLSYIKSRYGNPAAAWQHELANNWY